MKVKRIDSKWKELFYVELSAFYRVHYNTIIKENIEGLDPQTYAKVWETFGKTISLLIIILNFIEFTINSSTQRGTLVQLSNTSKQKRIYYLEIILKFSSKKENLNEVGYGILE